MFCTEVIGKFNFFFVKTKVLARKCRAVNMFFKDGPAKLTGPKIAGTFKKSPPELSC